MRKMFGGLAALFFLAQPLLAQTLPEAIRGTLHQIRRENACRKETIAQLESLFSLILSGFFVPHTSMEQEPNNEPVFANPITLNGEGEGSLTSVQDVDYWKIYLPESGELGVALTADRAGAKLALYRYGSRRELKKDEEPFQKVHKLTTKLEKGLYFAVATSASEQRVAYTLRITFLPDSLK